MSSSDSSSVSVRPSRAKSRSSRKRRVGSASALNTRSSSVMTAIIGDQIVTCQITGSAGGIVEPVEVDAEDARIRVPPVRQLRGHAGRRDEELDDARLLP